MLLYNIAYKNRYDKKTKCYHRFETSLPFHAANINKSWAGTRKKIFKLAAKTCLQYYNCLLQQKQLQ